MRKEHIFPLILIALDVAVGLYMQPTATIRN